MEGGTVTMPFSKKNLKQARENSTPKMTQADVCRALSDRLGRNIATQQLSDWESESGSIPGVNILELLAEIYGVSIDDFLHGEAA